MDNLPKNTNLIPPNPQIEVDSLSPFTRFCISIGAIPISGEGLIAEKLMPLLDIHFPLTCDLIFHHMRCKYCS